MRPFVKILTLGLLMALAGGRDVGSSSVPASAPLGESRETQQFAFRVDTPDVSISAKPEGFSAINIEGFGTRERRPGAPDIPSKTVLVAIPPGVTPTLAYLAGEDRLRPGVRPSPVPRQRVVDVSAGDESSRPTIEPEYAPDPSLYSGSVPYPAKVAWLGEVGILRDQRYVAVHLAPVRYDPAAQGIRVTSFLELSVHFEGDTLKRAEPVAERWFEDVYRNAFVNYAQGSTFRIGALEPAQEGGAGAGAARGEIDATTERRRIRIRENGMVRLDFARIATTDFVSEPISTWKLTNRGEEVPLHVRDGNGNDMLEPGDWVRFYGQALDDEDETELNTDLGGPIDLWEMRDFTDENIYFLTAESGARARMATRDSSKTGTRVPPANFEAVAHEEVEDAWRPLGEADPWYWCTDPEASCTLSDSGTSFRLDTVPLPGLASGSDPTRVLVHLQGRNDDESFDPDHHTRVTLTNATDQVLDTNDAFFDGRTLFLHDFTWDGTGGTLTDPAKVRTEVLPTAASRNDAILDYIEIRYPKLFALSGGRLSFEWPDEDAEFEIFGLTSGEVYEITGLLSGSDVVDPVLLTGDQVGTSPGTIRFRIDEEPGIPDGSPRRFVVVGSGGTSVLADPDFETDTVSDLASPTNQADMIVIAHPDLLDDPANCSSASLTALLNHRFNQDGIVSKVACLQDIQDDFNDGLEGPLAIKRFLFSVMSAQGWATPKPSFVMLLGDGSYEYKSGTGGGNFVPTQIMFKDDPSIGYYASDNILGAVSGVDELADLMIGRISVRTLADANTVLDKIVAYETSAPAGSWQGNALLVSDRGKNFDVEEAEEFERINDKGAPEMKQPPHTTRKLYYWSDPDYCNESPGSCIPGTINQDIKDAVNGVSQPGGVDGAAVMQFIGHGNFDLWSDDVIFCANSSSFFCSGSNDTDDLTNGSKLPWLLVHNCLTGGFHTPAVESFGESWLARSGGGAVAVFAPSGLEFRFIGERVIDSVWPSVFGPTKNRTIGVPVMESLVALCGPGNSSIEACQNYVLLGDPATRLQIPAPEAPSDPGAVAGNGVVDLSWTASPSTGVTYDVLRSKTVTGNFAKVNGAPITGTTFPDTTVLNATTYYYTVVAVDVQGYESRWSNFNSDCQEDPLPSGPDCVKGTPINPNPPDAPTGLVVLDTENGGSLELTWNANVENDVLRYDLHWGTVPGVYTETKNVQNNTIHTLTALENGVEYFIALTATNTSGNTSGLSQEKSGIPTLIRGVRSPDLIVDLRLAKSGNDAVLSWGAVTNDIYGKPETVGFYEVYRDTSAIYLPSGPNRIGTPSATSLSDTGALLPAGPDYYYLVRAVDVDGNPGGLGSQLPDGIGDLAVDPAGECSLTVSQNCRFDAECPGSETCNFTTTDILLSWTAVTTDFDGLPLSFDRYDVYASETPFTREQARDGAVPKLGSTGDISLRISPPAEDRHYSVIAVDTRGNESPF